MLLKAKLTTSDADVSRVTVIENPDRIISGSGRSSGKHHSCKLANRDLGRSCNPAKRRTFQATIQGYRQNGEKSGEIWLNPHR
jgi:hypothetical protein